ncbi:alpha/beta hydrolase [Defluviimonas sp. WL0024]|uniref:Alpha/beta hydrolase n=1 Tax=Albidovulum salinarum TaxID=2984153 RepID=A0ABT2X392_9RHOB|nr:alpha/beta hydrolase [Defluviimonas sp. WL0024]MCU9848393.1 alpha/beta hydrolase [Defluviimonas sp. WL0024]
MDYLFVARTKKGDSFGDEPAASHFVAVPETSGDILWSHRIAKTAWRRAVMEAARGGTPSGLTKGDIVFYVHGFNISQALVLERHRKIRAALAAQGFAGIVVSFDWPSADSALNYLEDRDDAKSAAHQLVTEGIAPFARLQEPDCRIDMHVLAHSTGAYVVREAFDDADDRMAVAAHNWSVSQVLLFAADVSVQSLDDGNPKSSSLYRHCVRLTNYYNPLDEVLSISAVKRIGVARRAGRVGLDEPPVAKAVNVYCGAHFRANQHLYGTGITAGHTWYFDDPVFMQDVHLAISGQLDRHEFPTRAPTTLGNLALKAP